MCECASVRMQKSVNVSRYFLQIYTFVHHSAHLHIKNFVFKMKAFYGDLRLGILGGGQLGRMLIQQAINYNVTVKVLDPDREAPCCKLCDEFIVGSLGDYETVYNFGKRVDLLTIEIEKVNVDALEQLEKEGILVYPQPRIIRLIQDKGL